MSAGTAVRAGWIALRRPSRFGSVLRCCAYDPDEMKKILESVMGALQGVGRGKEKQRVQIGNNVRRR
jgi:hypothetical protein